MSVKYSPLTPKPKVYLTCTTRYRALFISTVEFYKMNGALEPISTLVTVYSATLNSKVL